MAALAATEFSHKPHLGAKLPCTVCHSAAPSSTQVSDNLLPPAGLCGRCHKDGRKWERGEPRRAQVAKFNHSLHVKLGAAVPAAIAKAIDAKEYLGKPGEARRFLDTRDACAGCHRGLAEAAKVTAVNFPAMADCLTCHTRIEPPYSCEKCHVNVKALTPATHTQEWVDKHTNPAISKADCASCHGRRFTCQGCH